MLCCTSLCRDDEEDFENIFKDQFKFGAVLAEFDCAKGWIEDVRWAPSGFRAAFIGAWVERGFGRRGLWVIT